VLDHPALTSVQIQLPALPSVAGAAAGRRASSQLYLLAGPT
jgi:hypothetical protein